ncbi:phage holin family protein [Bacteroidota bacterium]
MQSGSSNFLVRVLITSFAVLITAYLLPGVHVDNFLTALILALVLALMNVTLKPLLIFLTIPFTIVTLGLFLLVINAVVILISDAIIPGFIVDGFWWALLFSLVLSLINTVLQNIAEKS